jgi:hypothetical protein
MSDPWTDIVVRAVEGRMSQHAPFPAMIFVVILAMAAGCGHAGAHTAPTSQNTGQEPAPAEIAERCVQSMKSGALGWGDKAARPGFRVSRIVRVYSFVQGLPDYFLTELADSNEPLGWAKVGFDGSVLAAGEKPLVRPPLEADVREALAKHGVEPTGTIRWVAVNGPPALEAFQPFTPLAEFQGRSGTMYVNCALRVFALDPSGAVTMETKDGPVRVRLIR